jgi:hypothetical protein
VNFTVRSMLTSNAEIAVPESLWMPNLLPVESAKRVLTAVELAKRLIGRRTNKSAVGICSLKKPTNLLQESLDDLNVSHMFMDP